MDQETLQSLRDYGGPLSDEQIALLRDIQGWLEFCIQNGLSFKSTISLLAEDANGILANVPMYRPKVSGYSKYLKMRDDLSGLSDDDPNADDPHAPPREKKVG